MSSFILNYLTGVKPNFFETVDITQEITDIEKKRGFNVGNAPSFKIFREEYTKIRREDWRPLKEEKGIYCLEKEKQQFPMEEESQSQSTSHHAVTKRKKKSKKEKQQFPLEEESQSQSPSHCTVTKCDKKSKKEKQPFPMEKGKYQRKSLRYLVEIRDLLSKLVEVKDPENSKFHIEKINNSDQLDELEEVIKDDVQRKAILSKLKNIGGVDMADCTRNMLGKLFSVNLMANMNIKGSKRKGRENKISFENLKLKDVMFEALQDRYTVSEKELFRVVGNKLKNAPGRLNHSIDI
ncbi:uncharacterized protein LOC124807120 [Hydra vulgaris]|uniref:uncharacterized protein LOC124807120 n=1 Tax=Hydra vulgaris TaxID=6087 RepID=UPI0032EA155F